PGRGARHRRPCSWRRDGPTPTGCRAPPGRARIPGRPGGWPAPCPRRGRNAAIRRCGSARTPAEPPHGERNVPPEERLVWVGPRTWPGSLPHGQALEGTDLDRAAALEDRAAPGELGGGIEGVGLDQGKAADDLLDLDERPVGDDLPGVDDASFLLQPVAGVEHPALAQPFADPRVPFLEHLLHLFGRQRVVGLAAVAVDKQESGHVRVPFLPEACQRPAPCGPPFTLMTNESGTRGQEAASFSTATEDLHMRTACGAARWASARGLLEEESADPAQVLPGRPAQGAPLRTQPGSSV